jgi:hypothetical protein
MMLNTGAKLEATNLASAKNPKRSMLDIMRGSRIASLRCAVKYERPTSSADPLEGCLVSEERSRSKNEGKLQSNRDNAPDSLYSLLNKIEVMRQKREQANPTEYNAFNYCVGADEKSSSERKDTSNAEIVNSDEKTYLSHTNVSAVLFPYALKCMLEELEGLKIDRIQSQLDSEYNTKAELFRFARLSEDCFQKTYTDQYGKSVLSPNLSKSLSRFIQNRRRKLPSTVLSSDSATI